MEQQELVAQLEQCKPLAHKLSEQRYDYALDKSDLQFYTVYDQIVSQLPDPKAEGALAFVERLFELSGIFSQERFWLNAWYEMAPGFQEFVVSSTFNPSIVYRPFAERLEAITALTNQLLEEQIIRLHDTDWLSLPLMASENPAILPLAEKLLLNRLAQAAGQEKAVLELTPREEALLEYMHTRRNDLGPGSLLPPDPRMPSQETKAPWIMATVSAWKVEGAFPRGQQSGKWIMEIPRNQVDAVWTKIAQATREGQLGKTARVSTARPPRKGRPSRPNHRIEVLIPDTQNQELIERVGTMLQQLSITQPISYQQS